MSIPNALKKIFAILILASFASITFGQASGSFDKKSVDLPRMEDWFLSTGSWENDPQLYVREYGQGSETVVMLHGGWGGEHSGLIAAAEQLKDDYHFVFYDQRGSLRSPAPDSSITFDRHIEDLELLRKELGMDKLNLVGHSMGAILACAYASKYPDRIQRLVLQAPPSLKNFHSEQESHILEKGDSEFEEFMQRPEVEQELEKHQLNRTEPALSSREETSKFRIQFAKRMLSDISKWPFLTGGRALFKGQVFQLTANTYPEGGWDYIEEFKRRTYPVSIIVGNHDFLDFGNRLTRHWVRDIPHVDLRIIENAGHIIWLDQPEAFAKEFKASLDRK